MFSSSQAAVGFGRETAGTLEISESKEWLVTNGRGSYASGTVSSVLTRRYHGLLVAALKPPLGRTLLVTKFDETASYDGKEYALFTNRWASQTVDLQGYLYIESFQLEGSIPTWNYAFGDALLQKRIWMEPGADTTYVHYHLHRASLPVKLTLKSMVNYRDFHGTTQAGTWRMDVEQIAGGIKVAAFENAVPFYIFSDKGSAVPVNEWYYSYFLSEERFRGLECVEDHLLAGVFEVTLEPGDSITLIATTDASSDLDSKAALMRRQRYESELLMQTPLGGKEAPAWIRQLVLAADQFIVDRPLAGLPKGKTVIAGYPWFGDWGRDTMISLAGLTLATGRPSIAKGILKTFAKFADKGMLPNYFPDEGEKPEYNTVDAALWYFEAIRLYLAATGDKDLVRELFPVLTDIISWYQKGTRYRIHIDPNDGLLYAGEEGVQLTWMDAKAGSLVVTPRIGKAVEVNALWYHALKTMAFFAKLLGESPVSFEAGADHAKKGFARFWNGAAGYCFDLIDSPRGNDSSLRPNQIFAVSLAEDLLTLEQQRAVVEACGRKLLTTYGLRSLDPDDPDYRGHYGGNPFQRDSVYHQGTVWGWLLGPYSLAHLKVNKDAAAALEILQPIAYHLFAAGLGTCSEIFDGDPPMTPRGCIAQAWTVAQVLQAWQKITCQGMEEKDRSSFAMKLGKVHA